VNNEFGVTKKCLPGGTRNISLVGYVKFEGSADGYLIRR
jgi:hypothetical protein